MQGELLRGTHGPFRKINNYNVATRDIGRAAALPPIVVTSPPTNLHLFNVQTHRYLKQIHTYINLSQLNPINLK